MEAQTTTLRLFQPTLVPGLLQTPEYIHAVLALHELSRDVIARTAAERLGRQKALYGSGKSFHFLITEGALRWRFCSGPIVVTQLDRLMSLSRLPSVRLEVLPLSVEVDRFATSAFCMFDQRLVTIELFHAEVTTRDPRDVALYLETFNRLSQSALSGQSMRNLLGEIRDEFLPQQESP
ncbi:hypothetical protein E1298_45215 [Actinomadura rubrisoli]|uniref:DUF5753 domain-containing protein n=1 Tax=Actinomadura rubrisoli TaxID=2530368 RepID=A0A4R4ZRS8_9ACTN|nr:hypothetical protein E1298_45215 [Actinomadura rubrisoli]